MDIFYFKNFHKNKLIWMNVNVKINKNKRNYVK